jgi:hypothetical protein
VLTDEEYRNRNPNEYGFIKGENSREPVGFQLDESYTSQIPSIPRVSADGGPGFLKVCYCNQTDSLISPPQW